MADPHHVAALREGPRAWNEFRTKNQIARPDFTGENLAGLDLSEKIPRDLGSRKTRDLCMRGGQTTSLSDMMHPEYFLVPIWEFLDDKSNFPNLAASDFSECNLNNAFFGYSNLQNARFAGARLHGTKFNSCDLSAANFSGAHVAETDFEGAMLDDAEFSDATISHVYFLGSSLRHSKGLQAAVYKSGSAIDLATVGRSGTLPAPFLRGCGLPDKLIEALALLVDESDQYYSCFISYSHEDSAFANQLYQALQAHDIRCWLDVHQMLPGDDIYEQVDKGIRLWDKVLLCCSRTSLTSWWVDNEVDSAFHKERELMKNRGHKTYALIPLDLDGFMFSSEWTGGKKRQLNSRIAANFHGWRDTDALSRTEVDRVVQALRVGDRMKVLAPKPKL